MLRKVYKKDELYTEMSGFIQEIQKRLFLSPKFKYLFTMEGKLVTTIDDIPLNEFTFLIHNSSYLFNSIKASLNSPKTSAEI
jgi:hypothetical protein